MPQHAIARHHRLALATAPIRRGYTFERGETIPKLVSADNPHGTEYVEEVRDHVRELGTVDKAPRSHAPPQKRLPGAVRTVHPHTVTATCIDCKREFSYQRFGPRRNYPPRKRCGFCTRQHSNTIGRQGATRRREEERTNA